MAAAPAFAEGKPINIEPQSLASALREFASQSQQAILVAPALADGKSSKGVHDATDPELALAQLLQGTGLTWRRSGEALLIVSASDPQSGSAAGDGADSGTVQALIVTAQKREEDIQDVPIAISAFTQEDLTRSQVAGGPDLMTQVPNFTFTKTNFSGYSIQIRGIGTQAISATVDPAVAVAFNNTPFIRNRFFEQEFYDLQRVEVLRGPQGTLYGRNATAGVVNIISAKPNFRYEAKLSGDVSNYKSTRFEGMLNIPLAEDKVALRLAGAWTKRDGYVTNQITGNPIDGRDLWSTRLSLRIEPTDRIKANLVWEHFQEDDDRLRSGKQLCKKDLKDNIAGVPIPPINDVILSAAAIYTQGCVAASLYADESFQTPNGFALPYFTPLSAIGLPVDPFTDPYLSTTQSHDLRVIESTLDPKYRAKSDLGEVQIGIDLTDNLTLTSETAYSTDFLFSTQDYNRFNTTPGVFRDSYGLEDSVRAGLVTNGIFCDPQLGCANRLVGEDLSTARSRQFSQEIRLSSDFEGAFNFSGGVNLLRYDTEDKYYVFFNTLTLFSAGVPFRVSSGLPAWEPGVSDSHECLRPGILPGDPLEPQRVDDCIYIDPNPIDHLNDMGHNYFLSKNPYKLISYAAFGEAYYQLMSNLKVTAGLRWTVDKKEAPQYPSWLLANQSAGYPVFEVIRQEWREPTGRITVDWKPDFGFTDETLIYGSYAHGYKAGGANPPPALIATALNNIGSANNIQNLLTHPRTFDPEFVDAFELGAKNTLADGRLTLNATVFYYDYTAYQISEIVDRSAINMNFDAKVWGAELEADWRPLENLRLGFKGGYENTRVADGMKAIDLMDRTAGDPNYVVARPFPTVPSNCILPVSWVTFGDRINVGDSLTGPCVLAYQDHVDPITGLPYVADPTVWLVGAEIKPLGSQWAGYPGFDPSTVPNNGEGIFKDLSGNALPNAPHFTATLTADYTVPLPHDWLMTLHTDLYYQSEAWTRIFNDSGYDKLKAYNNVNFAAIFSNEDAGWQIMAYVKNVFDKDNITGAFLNSDDTALTTNVFLNEPRLYGLRVTKNWTGGSVWGSGARHDPGLPYRFRVELGGSIQRQDAPYSTVAPSFADAFSTALSPLDAEHGDLDWGDGREVKLTYTPTGPWSISLGARYGKTNGDAKLTRTELAKGGCGLKYDFCLSNPGAYQQPTNYANTSVHAREEHTIADFMVGRDLGIGAAGFASKVSVGLQYARLKSETGLELAGIPNWYIPPEYWAAKYSTRDRYSASLVDKRTFEGAGPVVSWDGSRRLVDKADSGRVSVDWTATGGVLFGNRKNLVHGVERDEFYRVKYPDNLESPQVTTTPVHDAGPSKSATVPTVDLSLGLSYEVQGFKVGAGYRWERFFNAIGSDDQSKSYDRTIDGPYFKVSVGFGG